MPFSTIDKISIPVERSSFTLVFFKAACNAEWNFARSCISSIYFKNYQLHQMLAIMYCFKHAGHDIFQYFSFQNLYKRFFRAHNLHYQCLFHLSECKNLIFQVMMFHWNFHNHPYIHNDEHLFAVIKQTYFYPS